MDSQRRADDVDDLDATPVPDQPDFQMHNDGAQFHRRRSCGDGRDSR